ncbi:MAG: MarR family winged helix-turn-helix transcriptional regulator [Kiritimatiellaeota bacterium]|nr:MarR family winged helix-turn-helix transcriptional regulator [Kiritimatiellota bacterium]
MDTQPQPIVPRPPTEQRPPFNEVSVLFPLLSLVTVAYLAMLVSEFFLHAAVRVPATMMPIYITLLGAYAADKEIRRWVGATEPQRKGSLFVYLWVLLFLVLVIINFFRADYIIPSDLGKVVLQVLGVFFGSRASKYIHERRAEAAMDPAELPGRQAHILEIIQIKGRINRADVIADLGVGRSTATNLLDNMVQEGLIQRAGEGRGTYYLAAEKTTTPERIQ